MMILISGVGRSFVGVIRVPVSMWMRKWGAAIEHVVCVVLMHSPVATVVDMIAWCVAVTIAVVRCQTICATAVVMVASWHRFTTIRRHVTLIGGKGVVHLTKHASAA